MVKAEVNMNFGGEQEQSLDELREIFPVVDVMKNYYAIVQDIVAHRDDLSYIYDRLDELSTKYPDVLERTASDLFYRFLDTAPLACFALFADSATRPYFWDKANLEECEIEHESENSMLGLSDIPQWYLESDKISSALGENKTDVQPWNFSIKRVGMLNALVGLASENSSLDSALGGYAQKGVIAGDTENYEVEIEPKGRKYMVLAFDDVEGDGIHISSADLTDTYDSDNLVRYGLLVLDGIRADCSSSGNTAVYYMEAR
jgi:hypothetical protein